MQIQVRYFAVFRERLRSDGELLELPDGADVTAALAALAERHAVIRDLRGRFQTAVNQEMVPASTRLEEGDELALIPPVAGGADRSRHVQVIDQPLSLDRCIAAVTGPGMGGITTFSGVVRETNEGRDVVRLDYEAYKEMAEKVIVGLCETIEAELPGTRLACEHRTGTLSIGDAAVTIAAAAPHRAEAFTACRALIDRLKEHAPIWKKEFSSDGSTWIGLGP
jgi:MoaE-MoaD fusion protein